MRRILTQTKNIILVFLLLSYGNVFAQTKTEYETAVISTGHASLSAKIIKNGSALEVWVKNNHPTKTYKVNFTANIRLGGTKGEIDKIHRPKREKVLPNVLSKEEIKAILKYPKNLQVNIPFQQHFIL